MRRVVVFAVLVPMTLMVVACGEDGPTTLAQGEDVEFVGDDAIGGQTLDITAEEDDGEVTGEASFNEIVMSVDCADTDTDDVVILGGEVTSPSGDGTPAVGEWMATIIKEGDPDSLTAWLPGPETAADSCSEFLESIPEEAFDDSNYVDVEEGSDIETG